MTVARLSPDAELKSLEAEMYKLRERLLGSKHATLSIYRVQSQAFSLMPFRLLCSSQQKFVGPVKLHIPLLEVCNLTMHQLQTGHSSRRNGLTKLKGIIFSDIGSNSFVNYCCTPKSPGFLDNSQLSNIIMPHFPAGLSDGTLKLYEEIIHASVHD